MPIRVLSADVAAKIAAGEVIERPASVVKELLENAIDAGASSIKVEIVAGGTELIRVVDDGCGIPPDELALAFQRHATSKLGSADDLQAVVTLGFRGEALPSIAAVADISLTSRVETELAGGFIRLSGGAVLESGSKGSAVGTVVTVTSLFADLPARRKFLKAPSAEGTQIGSVVTHYALAYPGVRLSLVSDGRSVFRSAGTGELRDVLRALYGADVSEAMLAISTEPTLLDSYTVTGYVSPSSVHRATRSNLCFFVNGRWIKSGMLAYATEEAYSGLLPAGRHPIAVICLQAQPQDMDVNVHPAKAEVKFLREREVFSVVQRAVRRAVIASVPIPPLSQQAATAITTSQSRFDPQALPASRGRDWPQLAPEPPDAPVPSAPGSGLPVLRVLGQMGATFIVAEGQDGIYLIDQHRAHERVLFETLRNDQRTSSVPRQMLLQPLNLDLSATQMDAVAAHREELTRSGFDIEPFGPQTALVRAVPLLLTSSKLAVAIGELLDELTDVGAGVDLLQKLAVSLACKGAIKSGQALGSLELRDLVERLQRTSTPPICPHGSPIIVHLSQVELEKQFGRR